jgi:hypothetical protein
MARFSSLSALALVLVAAAAALLSPPSSFFALALPGEGATALAEGAIAAVPTAACGAAMLKSMYCRVLQDPDGEKKSFFLFSPGFSPLERKERRRGRKKRREKRGRRGEGEGKIPLPNSSPFSPLEILSSSKPNQNLFLFQRKQEKALFLRFKKKRRERERNEKKDKERGREKREEEQGAREGKERGKERGEKPKKLTFPPPPPLSPEKLKALSGGTSGCCGNSTQIIVTPGVRDSRNSTVSYVPKSAEDCHLRCAADSTCLTASVFSNKGNLFCNLFAASTCRYSRLQCNPTDSDAPTFVVHGSWLFPCRSPKGGISEDDTALCTTGHGHGVDGWHEGHGVFVSGGNGGGGHNHG